jgi:hypothetical protein
MGLTPSAVHLTVAKFGGGSARPDCPFVPDSSDTSPTVSRPAGRPFAGGRGFVETTPASPSSRSRKRANRRFQVWCSAYDPVHDRAGTARIPVLDLGPGVRSSRRRRRPSTLSTTAVYRDNNSVTELGPSEPATKRSSRPSASKSPTANNRPKLGPSGTGGSLKDGER